LAEPIVQMLMHRDRTNKVTIRHGLQKTSAGRRASQANDDPSSDDWNTIVRLLQETAQLARSRFDQALRARLPGMTWARCAVLILLAQQKRLNQLRSSE
jgi:hypothetical protein